MSAMYFWLNSDPMVLMQTPAGVGRIEDRLPSSPIIRFLYYSWHISPGDLVAYHRTLSKHRPRHTIVHLINEEAVAHEAIRQGVPGIFCSKAAFLDERLYALGDSTGIEFDAIYIAKMASFKRHTLARLIPRLILVGSRCGEPESQLYESTVRRQLEHATIVPELGGGWLSTADVSRWIRRAKVGLCLSAVEGVMYAATEYLLSGRPVVTTESRGGRAEWFEPEFARTVEANPEAVARTTLELGRENIPACAIREATIQKLAAHRRRFTEFGQRIFDEHKISQDFCRLFYERFRSKCGHWRDPAKVMDYLSIDCPS